MKLFKLRLFIGTGALAGAAFCIAAFAGDVGIVNWGTYAVTYTANCISADCGGGSVSGGASGSGPEQDNVQGDFATSTISGSLGTATVNAGFETAAPGLRTFVFTGDATSTSLGVASGTPHALALYTYAGPTTTITITTTLSATFSGPLSGADSNVDGIEGYVRIFQNQNAIDGINFFEVGARLTCVFECYNFDDEMRVELDNTVSILSDSSMITLNDGDQFYLHGFMNLGAAGGGAASTIDGVQVSFSSNAGLTSIPGGGGDPDTDSDGVPDNMDNCTLIQNADQRDTNSDGYGNVCDPDVDNNGVVNFGDISAWVPFFNTTCGDVDQDFDGDGSCNFGDYSSFPAFFQQPPGPSGVAP